MIPKDLFSKIRHIQITTNRLVTDVFAGQYHSVFKGRGMEFDEVREYIPGDDIRTIDWNVTARMGKVHVKKYIEERELTVMLLVDASQSCHFASTQQLKSRLAAEIASVLAFSAIRNNDKVGLVFFTDLIEKFVPPRKGTKDVLRLVREILYFQPRGHKTDIVGALEYLSKIMTRRSVCFLISDFFDPASPLENYEKDTPLKKAMAIINKRHDLIAVTLNDPREEDLPPCGLLNFMDAEAGTYKLVDSNDRRTHDLYRQRAAERLYNRKRFFQAIGVDHIDLHTDKAYAAELIKFFLMRQKRFR